MIECSTSSFFDDSVFVVRIEFMDKNYGYVKANMIDTTTVTVAVHRSAYGSKFHKVDCVLPTVTKNDGVLNIEYDVASVASVFEDGDVLRLVVDNIRVKNSEGDIEYMPPIAFTELVK